MKKTVLTTIALVLTLVLSAQDQATSDIKGGTVYYDQVVKLNIKLEGENAHLASSLPKEQRSKKVLYFNETTALYKNNSVGDDASGMPEESGGMVIKIKQSDDMVFTDLKKKIRTEQREFMTRLFLIEQQLGDAKWKLTGNMKKVLDYACQEAVMEKDDKKITAWFAPAITVPFGPGKYGELPGLILALDVNDDEFVLVATAFDTKAIDKDVLIKPTKGKKVTDEEFKKIVDEKMKEMGVEGGQGGNHIMIRIKN